MSVVRQAVAKFSALRIVKAQNALLLLSGCLAAAALGYIPQVTPPRLARAAAQASVQCSPQSGGSGGGRRSGGMLRCSGEGGGGKKGK
jgi:hypothetical protein